MAHTFDTHLRFTGNSSPLTSNYTCGSSATVLVLGIVTGGSVLRTGGAPTYNSVALTQADETRKYFSSPETSCELWYLLSPPTGSAYSISVPNSNSLNLYVQASSYKAGSDKISVLDVDGGNTGHSSTPSVSVTTTVSGDVIVGVLGDGANDGDINVGSSGINLNHTRNGTYWDCNQYKLQTNPGAWATSWGFTILWDIPVADDWCVVVAAFKEAAGDQTVAVSVLSLSLSLKTPSINIDANQTIIASVLPLTLTLNAPTVYSDVTIYTVTAQALTLALKAPVVVSSPTVMPAVLPLSLSLKSSSVSIAGNQTVSISALVLTSSLKAPAISIVNTFATVPKIRMIPFIYSATIAYMCEFGDKYIRIFYGGAPLYTGAGAHVEVTTPYDESDLYELQYKQVGDVMRITHEDYPTYKLTRTSATTFSLDKIVSEKGPFLKRNDIENDDDVTLACDVTVAGDTGNLTASSAMFAAGHVNALFKLTHPRVNLKTEGSMAVATTGLIGAAIDVFGDYTFEITATGWSGTVRLQRTIDDWATSTNIVTYTSGKRTWTGTEATEDVQYRINVTAHTTGVITANLVVNTSTTKGKKVNAETGIIGVPLDIKGDFVFAFHGKLTGTIVLERNENGAGWETYRTYTSDDGDGNVRYTGTEDESNVKYRINVTDHEKGTVKADLSASSSTKSGIVRIDTITSTTVAAITVISDISFAAATKRWAEGAWSGAQGYPAAITFHEDRCVYGKGNKVWLSESDDYEDFEEGINDDDSFEIPILTTNKIRWLESANDLLVGTSGEELAIGTESVQKPFLSPTNWTVKGKTTYGSKKIQPVKVNDCVLFVDFVGRKVRELTFNGDKYVAPDLTVLSENITESGIISIAFQKNPDPILWCTLADGSLISMTYDREQNVVAWSDQSTDGWATSAAVAPSTDEDKVWISVIRSIGNTNEIYIEQFQPRTFTELEDAFFVDSGIIFTSAAPTTAVTGLDHLNGKTVAVLGNGVVLDDEVVSNGQITTSAPITKAIVGLPFISTVSPMRMDLSTTGGTTKGSTKKIGELVVSFFETLGAQYGQDMSHLYDIDFGTTSLFTGDRILVFDGGFDTEDALIIVQEKPLPCVVRAIVLRMDVTGR